jgi:pyruvate dehydrogenase E2 component (dihydrolipoamide acetyltransferase)
VATTDTGRVSPAVKRLAVEHQIDLSAVSGSGLGGRVLRDDVVRAAQAGPPHATGGLAPANASAEALRSAREAGLTRDDDPMPSTEIAEPRLVPGQLVLSLEVDFTRAAALIGELEEVWAEHDRRPTPGHLVIRAVALALRGDPALLRASGQAEASGVRISFEFFDGGSLVSSTINDADALPLEALVSRLNAAGDGDATDPERFTIVDLGSRGIDAVTPVLPASSIASLGLGRVAQRPSFAGASGIERRAFLTLSLVTAPSIETAAAVDFLASLRQYLEQPARLLLA